MTDAAQEATSRGHPDIAVEEGSKMNRREFLTGAAVAPAALLPFGVNADEGLPEDVSAALSEFRRSIPDNFGLSLA